MSDRDQRTIQVEALARVEGEGAMDVRIREGRLESVALRIYEPPRFFEAFLRGRDFTEPPDVTARICGICPVAYQMSACQAIEDACGVTVDGPLRDLRRLLYCGEWIESHALHLVMLHAPDFLGYDNAIAMAADHADRVTAGLELKKAGNQLLELIGGRAIHPINVKVGGFYKTPRRADLASMLDPLRRALDIAEATVDWVAGFEFPDGGQVDELVALSHPDEYAVLGGRWRSSSGLDIAVDEFADHVSEEHLEHTTALVGRLAGHGPYLVGPLARLALNRSKLGPEAAQAATRAGFGPDERNSFRSIVARAVELVQATSEAIRLIETYEEPDAPAMEVTPRAGVGVGWSEAPRGTLWHRYELDADGTILDATIIPPTSQNQAAIEADLFAFVEQHLDLSDDELGRRSEQLIRNYDPCISCATHFLDLTVDRR